MKLKGYFENKKICFQIRVVFSWANEIRDSIIWSNLRFTTFDGEKFENVGIKEEYHMPHNFETILTRFSCYTLSLSV